MNLIESPISYGVLYSGVSHVPEQIFHIEQVVFLHRRVSRFF
jgi:hypothetical protein